MEISVMCNRSNHAMTFIRVKVTINFTVRAPQLWQLCGNWRSKALPPLIALSLKGEAVGGGRDRCQPLAVVPHSCLEKADVRTRKKHSQKFCHIGYNIEPYGQSFFPNCISAWNGLAKDIAEANTCDFRYI